jgi:hypothetical protein
MNQVSPSHRNGRKIGKIEPVDVPRPPTDFALLLDLKADQISIEIVPKHLKDLARGTYLKHCHPIGAPILFWMAE